MCCLNAINNPKYTLHWLQKIDQIKNSTLENNVNSIFAYWFDPKFSGSIDFVGNSIILTNSYQVKYYYWSKKSFQTKAFGWKLSFSLLKFKIGRFFALLLQTDTLSFYANSALFIDCIAYLSPFSKFLLNKWPQRKQLIACLYADQLPFIVHITLGCYFRLL